MHYLRAVDASLFGVCLMGWCWGDLSQLELCELLGLLVIGSGVFIPRHNRLISAVIPAKCGFGVVRTSSVTCPGDRTIGHGLRNHTR